VNENGPFSQVADHHKNPHCVQLVLQLVEIVNITLRGANMKPSVRRGAERQEENGIHKVGSTNSISTSIFLPFVPYPLFVLFYT
jgi:hypothetical protein